MGGGSTHNLRLLRFLLVLGVVVLTIFIYASYATNASLTPPHMHAAAAAGGAGSPLSASLIQHTNKSDEIYFNGINSGPKYDSHPNRHINDSRAIRSGDNGSGAAIDSPSLHAHENKIKSASASSNKNLIINKKPHHREPTIDKDAVGDNDDSNGNGNGLDDEAALDRFINSDLLEEQYGQNVDNILGNINTLNASSSVPQDQQQKQKGQQLPEIQQQINQLSIDSNNNNNNSNNNNNNLNKILDSDVLIPTSNLQKFIENADKILKNITVSPSAPIASEKEPSLLMKKVDPLKVDPGSGTVDGDVDDDNSVTLSSSVIMTIKHPDAPELSVAATKEKIPQQQQPQSIVKPMKTNTTITAAAAVAVSHSAASVDPNRAVLTEQIYESGHINEELNIERLCPNKGADLRLFIFITSAHSHTQARLAIRQTWGHYGTRRDVSIAFILGRSTNYMLNDALSQENFLYGDIIRGNFVDSYNNLTLKIISSLEWVDTHCSGAKFVLKTDDDMFINVPKLLTFIDSHFNAKRTIYGRLAKKWKPIRNKKSKYFVSEGQFAASIYPSFTTGPAYVMSQDIIHDLYVNSLHHVYLKLEDVFTTGIVAEDLGIKRVHVNEFLNRRIAFNPCNIRKTISVHMIKSNEQFDLWKKLLDQSTKCK